MKACALCILVLVLGSASSVAAKEMNTSFFLSPNTFDGRAKPSAGLEPDALVRIVERHPVLEFRAQFKNAFTQRRFAVTWMAEIPGSALDPVHQCMELRHMDSVSGLYKVGTPVLVIKTSFLTDPLVTDDERELALWHEWIHLTDLFADTDFFRTGKSDTEEAARHKYRVELRAYYFQLVLAKKIRFSSKLFPYVPFDTGGIGAVRFALALQILKDQSRYQKFRDAIFDEASRPVEGVPLQ